MALAICLLQPAAGRAKETDSFTHRYEALAFPTGEVDGQPVSDFTGEFNARFQQVFAEVLSELNEENRRSGESCRSERERRRLFRRMSNGLGGPILAGNRLRPAINRHPNGLQTVISESIYRDFGPWRSISLGLAGRFGHKLAVLFRFDLERLLVDRGGVVAVAGDGTLTVLGPDGPAAAMPFRPRAGEPAVVAEQGRTYYLLASGQALVDRSGEILLVTPILVSSDKFSHFFNRSLGLFERLETGSERSVEALLERNLWLEDSLFGGKSTGVAAYGDLVANFQGVRFWIHLLGQSVDGLPMSDLLDGGEATPIVRCSSGGDWLQTRVVDIREYLDAAWDEALNCSRLRSGLLLAQVQERLEILGREDELGRPYRCPVDAGLIDEAASEYGRFADWLINARGHSVMRAAGWRPPPEPAAEP